MITNRQKTIISIALSLLRDNCPNNTFLQDEIDELLLLKEFQE